MNAASASVCVHLRFLIAGGKKPAFFQLQSFPVREKTEFLCLFADYNGFRGGCNFGAVSHTKAQRTQRESGRIYARLPDRKARNGQ
ncbi:MAG: hypothetical protein DRI57_09505, partial [Deltaproteobacteria bacterium]